MKRHLFLLMLTILVVVMSELQVAGMMPSIAADLGTSIGQVGLLVSMYSLGMALGGPPVAYRLRHAPPKRALLMVVSTYTVLEALVPVVHEYWWVAILRIMTGCLAGAAFGLSVTFGAQLAETPARIGEAISIVLGGIMVGTVIGLPLSHHIAGTLGWQASFYILSAAALCLFIASAIALPHREAATQEDAAQDIRNLRSPRLWSRYLVSLLTIGAAYGSFSYFTPLLEQSSGLDRNLTTAVLLAYGIFSFLGNLVVGRFADRHAVIILRIGHSLLAVSLSVIAIFSTTSWLVVAMVLVVGLAGVTMNPALVTRVAEVGGTGNLVSTIHTSVITMGVTLGTAISAGTISIFGNDPTVAMWTGAAFAVLAAGVLALQTGSRSRSRHP
ncbi:MAG: MFS transporter [Arachnia propionica]|uniref:MFS transporter n=1 Tax=Arachnia propionica TaxID=1750 RepID=UPI002703F7D5|nr:MFS transporter [Arachnia propionica]